MNQDNIQAGAYHPRARWRENLWVTTSFFFAASTVKKKHSTANLQNSLIFIKYMYIVVFCF